MVGTVTDSARGINIMTEGDIVGLWAILLTAAPPAITIPNPFPDTMKRLK